MAAVHDDGGDIGRGLRVGHVQARHDADAVEVAEICVAAGAGVTHRRPVEAEPVPPDPLRMDRMRARAGLLVQQEIAAAEAERRAAERVRARELPASDRAAELARQAIKAGVIVAPDRGADGPAMALRPLRPLEAMGLDARQAEAAAILRDTWRDALPAMELPGGFGDGSAAGLRHLTHDQYLGAERSWHDYKVGMSLIGAQYGAEHEAAVRDAVIREEPAPAWRVREGLDLLAVYWGLR